MPTAAGRRPRAPHPPPSRDRMRLLIGNKFWYPKGGVETYLFELIEELPACGYDVIPFAMKHARNLESAYADFFVDEVDYHAPQPWPAQIRMAARMLYSRHAASKLAALVDAHPPDLAHLHNIYHQLSPAILPFLAARNIPVVMTLHDLKLACPNYKMRTDGKICERCVSGGYHHAVLHRCVRGSLAASALCAVELFAHRSSGLYENNVDRFIVPSRFYLQKMIDAGLPASKLVWIPSFTHVERYVPRFGGDDYFVYIGRLSDEKGILTLVDAVRGFRKGRLLIVGEGPLRGELERVVAADRLENVDVVGPKWGTELVDLMRGARFSVIPSEWYENCPRSCIESFACGTPVIGANIGGIPEMIDDGETGLLFTPFSAADLRDKIEHLFEAKAAAVQMGKAARLKAEREYSPHAHLQRLLAVYREATGKDEGAGVLASAVTSGAIH
jgi:glycosyltransferase involved in cell wall biosynthesis